MNLTSRNIVKATPGLVITAAYSIDPTFRWLVLVNWGLARLLYGSSSTIAIGTLAFRVGVEVARPIILSI